MEYLGEKYLILGVSKSGRACAEYLLSKGAECYIYEELKSSKIDASISDLVSMGAKRVYNEISEEDLNSFDACVISPGVPINHPVAVRMKKAGKKLLGEFELGYQATSPFFIAVTGTNGKTTTVSLLDQILHISGKKHCLVGNVGYPITSEINNIDKNTHCVAEISSFQLESVVNFKPNIACLLNVKPDHLERHYTMENYIFLKRRIFANQDSCDYAILNYDDETVKTLEQGLKSKITWVSCRTKVKGAYLFNGQLFYNGEYILDAKDIPLVGEHNVYNALFAICSAKLMGIDNALIAKAIKEFKGVKHRMELCFEKNGVKYFNDSKSTNTASTISAISALKMPTVLILGGSEKGESYDVLFSKIKESTVKHIVITGASRFNMLNSAGKVGIGNVTVTSDFKNAVKIATLFANDGDAVLLSPACASFDNFSGYEERGNVFVSVVGEIN